MYSQDILKALAAELAIFCDRWRRKRKGITQNCFTNPSEVITEIRSNDIYVSINSGQDKFQSFVEQRAQKRIDEISTQFSNDADNSIYGTVWDQFWPAATDYQIESLPSEIRNTIYAEGKNLLLLNLLCRTLFLCLSVEKEQIDDLRNDINVYQNKLLNFGFGDDAYVKMLVNQTKSVVKEKVYGIISNDWVGKIICSIDRIVYWIPTLLGDVNLLLDRHGKPNKIKRYTTALYFKLPSTSLQKVCEILSQDFDSRNIDYKMYPIAQPTATFCDVGLWCFLDISVQPQQLVALTRDLLRKYKQECRWEYIKIFLGLSEELRLKTSTDSNVKCHFGHFPSYSAAFSNAELESNTNYLKQADVIWVVEDTYQGISAIKTQCSKFFETYESFSKEFLTLNGDRSSAIIMQAKTRIQVFREVYKTMKKCSIFVSYAIDSELSQERVDRIVARLKAENFDVFYYEDEPFGTDLPKFMRRIEDSDITLIIGSESYKEKAYMDDSSGVSFEDRINSSIFMSDQRNKIVPVFFGEINDCIPKPFNTLKGMKMTNANDNELNTLVMGLINKYLHLNGK